MKITLLNHASCIFESEEVRLLTDPWYQDGCFNDGWGLQYANDDAMDLASTATHLWISHQHADHLHIPTLKLLAKTNNKIKIYANKSYNFDMGTIFKKLGFTNIESFSERKTIQINAHFSIKRYPFSGIDNMLLIESNDCRVLNLNDCVLPVITKKLIKKHLGNIDILLSTFNHAGKLHYYPIPEPDSIKQELKSYFLDNIKYFNPSYAVPFASFHYYKAPESLEQNDSLLTASELTALDKRIKCLTVNDSLIFNKNTCRIDHHQQPTINHSRIILKRDETVELDTLLEAANSYIKKLSKLERLAMFFIKPLYVHVNDHQTAVALSYKGAKISDHEPDISAHSKILYQWFTESFGTISFTVGAHYKIVSPRVKTLKYHLLIGGLMDNKLDPVNIIKMLLNPEGWRFFWNRREQIIGILVSKRFDADYQS